MTILLRKGLTIATLIFSMAALGLTLPEAKNQGLVGEQTTGYLGIVGQPTSDIEALIKDINARRHSAYENIAKKNNTSVEDVEKLAGQKAMQKTAPGQYVKSDGRWVKVQ